MMSKYKQINKMVNNGRIKGKMGNGINFGTDVICIKRIKIYEKYGKRGRKF